MFEDIEIPHKEKRQVNEELAKYEKTREDAIKRLEEDMTAALDNTSGRLEPAEVRLVFDKIIKEVFPKNEITH